MTTQTTLGYILNTIYTKILLEDRHYQKLGENESASTPERMFDSHGDNNLVGSQVKPNILVSITESNSIDKH